MYRSITFYVLNPASLTDENAPEELECEAEVNITSLGSPQSWDHPGDPPEWEVDSITVEGREIPLFLTPFWWPLYEWYYLKRHKCKPRKPYNPEWDKYQAFADKHMEEDFDWADHVAAIQDDYDEWRYEQSHYNDEP